MNHLFKRFRRDIIGLVWLAIGLFIGLSLWSYSPLDPSFNSIGKGLVSKNYCGYVGSFLADLLYQGFGLGAWLFVVAPVRMGLLSFRGHTIQVTRLRWAIAGLLLVTASALAALYFPTTQIYGGQILYGGEIGRLVSRGLIKAFNFGGVAIILWTVALVLTVFYSEKSLADWPRLMKNLTGIYSPLVRGLQILKELLARLTWLSEPLLVTGPKRSTLRQDHSKGDKLAATMFPLSSEPPKEDFQNEKDDEQEDERGASPSGPQLSLASLRPLQRRKVKLQVKTPRRVENWTMPKIEMLEDPPNTRYRIDEKELKLKARLLVEKLAQFSIEGEVVGVKPGPAVTLFEFKPAADVKISRITELADDLSLALSSESVRIIAPIPGRDVVGIETSNSNREAVFLKDVIARDEFWHDDCKLPFPLGRRADGEPRIVDLRKMPHLLVAGSTGSGKSVFVVSSITALIFRHSPKTLRLLLVDPKQVDLAAFTNLPHLVMPPIRDPKKAVGALRWAIREMEKRYRSMSKFGARGLESFNEIVDKLSSDDLKEHEEYNQPQDGRAPQDGYYFTSLPYLVIVVEEFGDLMAVDRQNVEQAVVRLAQMARACGIHLVLAMQSPRKDVVTGLIKTNVPGRISFKVSSKMDSRIILDDGGAERLLARGDMLFLAPGVAKPERHHGPFVSEPEINAVVSYWADQGEPQYDPLALRSVSDDLSGGEMGAMAGDANEFEDIRDDRYDEILAYVSTLKEVSVSLLQRRFKLGYPRAARMIEHFENEGIVGPANGSKPRQVLIKELR